MKNHRSGAARTRADRAWSAILGVLPLVTAYACGSSNDEGPAAPATTTPRLSVTFAPATATVAQGESISTTLTARRQRAGPRLSFFGPIPPSGVSVTSTGAKIDSLQTSITFRFDVGVNVAPGTYRVTSTTCNNPCTAETWNPADTRTATFLLTVAVGPR